jgi:hypothetical protein
LVLDPLAERQQRLLETELPGHKLAHAPFELLPAHLPDETPEGLQQDTLSW